MKTLEWLNPREFMLDGVRFHCGADDFSRVSDSERLVLLKDRQTLENYASALGPLQPRNILEFGVFQGGSPAFFSLWFDVQRFVGIDIQPPVKAFAAFCETHDIGRRIRTYYNTSQTDREAVLEILHNEFSESPPDLIIDDASHLYHSTRRTLEIPGGHPNSPICGHLKIPHP